MSGGYGTYHGGCAVGVFWDGIELSADGSQARITNAHIKIDRNQNITDSSNNLSWSGGAITDGSDANVNVDGSGPKTIKNCTETWVTLSYTGTTTAQFDANFSGINYAGQTLTVDKSVTFPQRQYDLAVIPTNVYYGGSLGNFYIYWNNNSSVNAPWQYLVLYRVDVNTGVTTSINIPNPGTATWWNDVVPANSRYYWYLASGNVRGSSWSATTATTPPPLHTLSMDNATPVIDQTTTFYINNNGSPYKSALYIDGMLIQSPTTMTSIGYTFNKALWASRLSSVTAKTVTVWLETWDAAQTYIIGTNTYYMTVNLPSPLGVYAPTAAQPTISERTAAVPAAFGAGIYLQNQSVVRVTHTGAPGLGATITKKEVIVNGIYYDVTVNGYVDIPVTWTTMAVAQSRTTDTRGQVAVDINGIGITSYAWVKPTIINFKVERCDPAGVPNGSGTQVKFTIDVSASSINNGVDEKNTMAFHVYLAVDGTPVVPAIYSKLANTTLTTVPPTMTGVIGALDTYSKDTSYSFILVVDDQYGYSTRISSIPTEIVPLSIGNNGIAIGKVYNDSTKALDVIGNTSLTGDLTVTGKLNGFGNTSLTGDLTVTGKLNGFVAKNQFNALNTDSSNNSWNNIFEDGLYPYLVLGVQPDGPGGDYYYVHVYSYGHAASSGKNVTQYGIPYSADTGATNGMVYRSRYNGVWGKWRYAGGTISIAGTSAQPGFQNHMGFIPFTGSPYRYVHVKLSIGRYSSAMVGFSALANLMYGQLMRSDMQLYTYAAQATPYQPVYKNYGDGGFVSSYYAPDSALVLVLDIISQRMYGGINLWSWGDASTLSGIYSQVTTYLFSAATSGQY